MEVAAHQVWWLSRGCGRRDRGPTKAFRAAPASPAAAHQASHSLLADARASRPQLGMDPRRAVRAVAGRMDAANAFAQRCIDASALAGLVPLPGIEAAGRTPSTRHKRTTE